MEEEVEARLLCKQANTRCTESASRGRSGIYHFMSMQNVGREFCEMQNIA